MQTKTADPSIPSNPGLVLDPARIPIFEGIKQRNGKRVGVRYGSVAFDMPRDISANSQSDGDTSDNENDLLDIIALTLSTATATVTRDAIDETEIDSYLTSRSLRPSTLKEVYHRKLLCDGALGAGKTVQTIPGSLTLDGFHRSNPFRHAYHQKHGKGPKITRELSIVFDSDQQVPDRLVGSYEEQITGLAKSRLKLGGIIRLERVSSVGQLDGSN